MYCSKFYAPAADGDDEMFEMWLLDEDLDDMERLDREQNAEKMRKKEGRPAKKTAIGNVLRALFHPKKPS